MKEYRRFIAQQCAETPQNKAGKEAKAPLCAVYVSTKSQPGATMNAAAARVRLQNHSVFTSFAAPVIDVSVV